MMPDTIRLLNPFLRAARIRVFHFYDGRAPVEGGVISIPAEKKHWVQRAYIMGYRNDPDTGRPLKTWMDAYGVASVPAVAEAPLLDATTDSAVSAGETNDEGSDAGGLPTGTDGVRESEPQGDDSPVEGTTGVDPASSDEPADGTNGDGASV